MKDEAHKTAAAFFKATGRADLAKKLGQGALWAYWTMEFYGEGIKGSGGLGMLASDTFATFEKLGIPSVFVTPFYPFERYQRIENARPDFEVVPASPFERGFAKAGTVSIETSVNGSKVPTELSVYSKEKGEAMLVALSEPNFGELYANAGDSDHRLYQEVSLGFGGWKALKLLGIALSEEAAHQMNEAPTLFSVLARIDDMMDGGADFNTAFAAAKARTIYTNHTLVPAAEASFSLEQFERFVMPNVRHSDIVSWLRRLFHGKGNRLKLSALALELSGVRNCVSKIHAREAGKSYQDYEGNPVEFKAVTNGISLERWGDPEFLSYLSEWGILDEFGLPTPECRKRADDLDEVHFAAVKHIKEKGRTSLREALVERRDQHGRGVAIPSDALIFDWRRRFAGYKRPNMVFEDLAEVKRVLEEENAHIILAGNVHPGDGAMYNDLLNLFKAIDADPELGERIHFIERYDEKLARALAQGADASLNTPQVHDAEGNRISTEACGTSWEKSILGNSILVSTSDGGVADPEMDADSAGAPFDPVFLEIRGTSHEGEIDSMYFMLRKAAALLRHEGEKWRHLATQLATFLPIISGSRMAADYFALAFPKAARKKAVKRRSLAAAR